MTSEELNIEIAKHYGFEKGCKLYVDVMHRVKMPQWTYPRDWYFPQGGVPNFHIPDFMTMLEDYMKLLKENSAFGKVEYFSIFEKMRNA